MSNKTPLLDEHRDLGASFTDFAGWQMPLKYGSELEEHHAVRTSAGLFDLSHMGEIELTGRGGHTSRPHLTEDLVFALAQIAVNVPAVLSRRVDVRSGVSVVWGQISAGSAPNAIPGTGYMAGTMRCLDRDAWHDAGELLDEVVKQVAAPYGVDVHLEHTRGVPPVVNSEHETALIEAAARAELGESAVVLTPQSMGGEDFAWFLADLPGAMMRLGTHTPGGEVYDLHRGDFIVDERALGYAIRVLSAAALRTIRDQQQ